MMKLLKLKTAFSKGQQSEIMAWNYLKKNQWLLITKNYKTKFGEIDILAEKNDTLVAFEVKFRQNGDTLPYTINKTQQQRIQNTLLHFIQNNSKYNDYNLRFDAVLINSASRINHIENAWEAFL